MRILQQWHEKGVVLTHIDFVKRYHHLITPEGCHTLNLLRIDDVSVRLEAIRVAGGFSIDSPPSTESRKTAVETAWTASDLYVSEVQKRKRKMEARFAF